MAENTCGEIIQPFIVAVGERVGSDKYQVIGGNGSAALTTPDTRIDLKDRQIYADPSCDLPKFRPDGSLRDIDVLVLDTDQSTVDAVEAISEEVVGDQLKRSVFGLKPIAQLSLQRETPIRSTLGVYLGDRYVNDLQIIEGQPQFSEGYKSIYPFAAPISSETLQTYTLNIPGRVPTPVPHPGETILNYLTRSISGERPKDVEKVEQIADTVLTNYPEIKEWIYDGPGRSKLELARILHTLRESRTMPKVLTVGEHLQILPLPYDLDELYAHPMFMDTFAGEKQRRALVAAAHIKGRAVHFGEKQQKLVTAWLKHIEPRIKKIVHND